MRLTFLGTSAGVPTTHRNVTGLAVALDDSRDWYLVDCGESSQHQLLRTRYSSARLRAIFITHVHGDHCYGLPGLIASANMSGRREPLIICAPDGIEQFVRAALEFTDVRRLRFPLEFIRSDNADFRFEDVHLRIEAIELSHRVPCYAYRFEEKPRRHIDADKLEEIGVPRGPLWNHLQDGESITLDDGRLIHPDEVTQIPRSPRSIIIAGDNDRPELLHEAMRRSDLLVHEATFTEDVLARIGTQYMHSTAAMTAKAASAAGLRHLILTHFSQRYRQRPNEHQRSMEDLRREAADCFSGNLILSEDFACYELRRDKTLSRLNSNNQ